MAKLSLLAAAVGAIALATAIAGTPAAAQDVGAVLQSVAGDPVETPRRDTRRGDWRANQAERPVMSAESRAQRQAERIDRRAERVEQRADAAQREPLRRNAPDGGWRSQRPESGERRGRNWADGGTVERPTPAWRGAVPAIPETRAPRERDRAMERNRGYADATRNREYRDPARQPRREERVEQRGTLREGYRVDRREDRREQRQDWRQGYRDGVRTERRDDRREQAWRDGYRDDARADRWQDRDGRWRNDRRWDRDDWRRDRRYDWYSYRARNHDVYRVGRYYAPYRNYRYSRLRTGLYLDALFFGQRYWINDPWSYRLPEVYGPYRWVRYYDDVLLVDIYSGEVVDVIHNFFW